MITYNFKTEPYAYTVPSNLMGEFKDLRNGFSCINPTLDLECYLNYVDLLNANRDKWKSTGYLDLGMMPIVMFPSFMHSNTIVDLLVGLMNQYGIPCHSMPPVSFMYNGCKLPEDDIWVFKSDVAKCTGLDSDKLTLERLIRWCQGK